MEHVGEIGKWQVHVSRPVDRIGADLTIFRHYNGGIQVVKVKEGGEMVAEFQTRGEAVIPTMRIGFEEDVRGILAAFVEAAAEFGVKRPQGEFAEGKLEAVEQHLGDMRRLVFKSEVQ